jgi:hypothetical protein
MNTGGGAPSALFLFLDEAMKRREVDRERALLAERRLLSNDLVPAREEEKTVARRRTDGFSSARITPVADSAAAHRGSTAYDETRASASCRERPGR